MFYFESNLVNILSKSFMVMNKQYSSHNASVLIFLQHLGMYVLTPRSSAIENAEAKCFLFYSTVQCSRREGDHLWS